MHQIGLFIPCYVDQLYPRVAIATLELLEHFGCKVHFPPGQSCCGQPMTNTGCVEEARPLANEFVKLFRPYDFVVCPSGSCTGMIRQHYEELLHHHPDFAPVRSKTFELCEFLHDVLNIRSVEGEFPHRVGFHQSCHGLRELRLGKASELMKPAFSKAGSLLSSLKGIDLVPLERPDECCGFGGTFAVAEEAVSCMMGQDRIHDHERAGAEIMTAGDMSCLMHLSGLARRQQSPLKIMHIAEILHAAIIKTPIVV